MSASDVLTCCVLSLAERRPEFLTPTPRGFSHGNEWTSQVPVSPLVSVCSCSSTPAGSTISDLFEMSMLLTLAGRRKLQQLGFRGSIARLSNSLCTLRSGDYSHTTQHSVPAVGQTFPGGLDPQGTRERFSITSTLGHLVSSLTDFLAQPALPWQAPS